MFKPFLYLTTTYLRRSVLWALPTFGMLIVGPWLMIWMIRFQSGMADLPVSGHETLSSNSQMSLYVNFVCIMFLAAGMIAWSGLPDLVLKAKVTLFPVSNRTLGTFLAVVPACLLMACNAFIQACYAVLFQNQWPIFTTTICFGALGMMVIAAAWWLRDFHFFKVPLVLGAIAVFGYWFAQHFYPDGFRGPVVVWDVLSLSDVGVLLLTAVFSWWLTVHAFAKYRCGEANFGKLLQYLSGTPHALLSQREQATVLLPQSQSAFESLIAMEWTKGKPIAVGTGCVTSLLLSLTTMAVLNGDRDPLRGIIVMLVLHGGICGVLLGIWLGIELWVSKTLTMKQFYSTLPFSDADLSRGFLRICFRGVLVCLPVLLTAGISACVVFAIFIESISLERLMNYPRFATRFSQNGFLGLGLLLLSMPLVTWTACGLMMSVTATGRQWVSVVVTTVTGSLVFLALILPIFFGSWGEQAAYVIGLVGVPGITFLGTIVLFVVALKRKLIELNAALLCALLALVVMVTIGVAAPLDIYWTLILSSAGCLVVTPIAALPVALAYNRHR